MSRFQPLARVDLLELSTSGDESLREAYVDALAILYDVVVSYGARSWLSRFDRPSEGERMLQYARRQLHDRLYPAIANSAASGALVVRLAENLDLNIAAVRELATSEGDRPQEGLHASPQNAERFARCLASLIELLETLPLAAEAEDDEDEQRGVEAEGGVAEIRAVHELAEQYRRIRSEVSPGRGRTYALEMVATRMRAHHAAIRQELARLQESDDEGERLAAVVLLQDSPIPSQLGWLVIRLQRDRPFIAYQAVIALESAAIALGTSHRSLLENTLLQARQALTARQRTNTRSFRRIVRAAELLAQEG